MCASFCAVNEGAEGASYFLALDEIGGKTWSERFRSLPLNTNRPRARNLIQGAEGGAVDIFEPSGRENFVRGALGSGMRRAMVFFEERWRIEGMRSRTVLG